MDGRHISAAAFALLVTVSGLSACSPDEPLSTATRKGQTSVIFTPAKKLPAEQLRQTAARLLRRATDLGVKDAKVSIRSGTVTVTAPGDQRERLTGLGASATLSFRPVLDSAPAGAGTGAGTGANAPGSGEEVSSDLRRQFEKLRCTAPDGTGDSHGGVTPPPAAPASEPTVLCDDEGETKYVLGPAELTERHVRSAKAEFDAMTGNGWQVQLKLTAEGGKAFAETSERLSALQTPRNQIAMALDDSVLSAPAVTGPIPGGEVQISGSFTQREAQRLATMIESGSLPVALRTTKSAYVPG